MLQTISRLLFLSSPKSKYYFKFPKVMPVQLMVKPHNTKVMSIGSPSPCKQFNKGSLKWNFLHEIHKNNVFLRISKMQGLKGMRVCYCCKALILLSYKIFPHPSYNNTHDIYLRLTNYKTIPKVRMPSQVNCYYTDTIVWVLKIHFAFFVHNSFFFCIPSYHDEVTEGEPKWSCCDGYRKEVTRPLSLYK